MKLTLIQEENLRCFQAAILPWWEQREETDCLIGLLDDCDRAAGVMVVQADGDWMQLKYLAVDDTHRGTGCGDFLIQELCRMFRSTPARQLSCLLYLNEQMPIASGTRSLRDGHIAPPASEERGMQVLIALLARNGFRFYDLNIQRCCYRLGDLEQAHFDAAEHPEIRRYDQLSIAEMRSIYQAGEQTRGTVAFVELDAFSNRCAPFSRFWTEDDAVIAMVRCAPYQDGVVVDSIYAPRGRLNRLPVLYGAVLRAVCREYGPETSVYIDTYGAGLCSYRDKLLPFAPKWRRSACGAVYTREWGE